LPELRSTYFFGSAEAVAILRHRCDLLSAAIAAAVTALRSSLAFAIAGPDTSTSAVTATLAAAMAAQLVAAGNTNLLPPVLIVIALATAATGIVLCLLGLSRTGRSIRFIPYPVIGGFLGATGWLMILGAIQVITDQRLTLATLGEFTGALMLSKLGAALAVAVTLHSRMKCIDSERSPCRVTSSSGWTSRRVQHLVRRSAYWPSTAQIRSRHDGGEAERRESGNRRAPALNAR